MLKELLFLTAVWLLIVLEVTGQFSVDLKAEPVFEGNEKSQPLMDVFGSNVQSALYNMRYYGEVGVGKPPKLFSVIFDTGSSSLWLPKVNCRTDSPANQAVCNANKSTLYDPKQVFLNNDYSKTSHKLPGKFVINYGVSSDKSSTHGDFFSDYFMLGNFKNPKQTLKIRGPVIFGAADFIHRLERGILGLGIPVANSPTSSIFDIAYREGLLDKPIFTLYFKKCHKGQERCQDGGVITFGNQDITNCEPKVLGSVSVFSYGGPWQYNLQSLKVGKYYYTQKAVVTSDSGSPLLHLPYKVVNGISKELDAHKEGNHLIVKCSRKFEIELKIQRTSLFIACRTTNLRHRWRQMLVEYTICRCRHLASGNANGTFFLPYPQLVDKNN
ncbi:Aspartic protease 9 [Aphelenchoides bicaudatus]|nr:Aspartic protease 9 [Aphelenchoides bicaudatus]